MGTQLSFPQKGVEPPVFCPCLLWPDGWMDQDATWHGGRSRRRPHCARWVPAPLPKMGQTPQFFGPYLLCLNGWMHPDATWWGGRPRRHCIRWGRSSPSPKVGGVPQFSALNCGQMAGWMKMPLRTEVDLSPGPEATLF